MFVLLKGLGTNFQITSHWTNLVQCSQKYPSRAAVQVHWNFRARSNLSGPSLYCIARTMGKKSGHSIGLAGATRLTRSDFRLNLLLLKGQRCVPYKLDLFLKELIKYPYFIFENWLSSIVVSLINGLKQQNKTLDFKSEKTSFFPTLLRVQG